MVYVAGIRLTSQTIPKSVKMDTIYLFSLPDSLSVLYCDQCGLYFLFEGNCEDFALMRIFLWIFTPQNPVSQRSCQVCIVLLA